MSFGVSIGDFLKLYESGMSVYKKCRDSPGEYKTLTNEARALTNVLQDLADKVEQGTIPESKRPQLLAVYEGTVEVLQELDATLTKYASLDTKSKRAWDRLTWDSDRSKNMRGKLTSSVGMLNGFWNSLIHDNQLIIIEALGRLEKDYAGGHREESRASVERLASASTRRGATISDEYLDSPDDDDEEDEAWPQIIRDLEDVGVSKQDAIEYRDFIIDWFVRAVNEGRLMEKSIEEEESPDADSFTRDLQLALPPVGAGDNLQRMPSWETPSFPPRVTVTRKAVGAPPSRTATQQSSHQSSPFLENSSSSRTSPLIGTTSPRPSTDSLYSPPERVPSREWDQLPVPVQNPQLGSQSSLNIPSGTNTFPGTGSSAADPPLAALYQVPSIVLPENQSSSTPMFSAHGGAYSQPPTIVHQAAVPSVSPSPSQSPARPPIAPPPAYDQLQSTPSSTDSNLIWTAQLIVTSWNDCEYVTAGKHLEDQLAAVRRGESIMMQHQIAQPTARLLMHLIGVSASFSGNFLKAKSYFEATMRGPYTNGANMDDGDIAAARWLGDTCLHLNEPENAGLAWAMALDGLLVRYGITRHITRRVLEECRILDLRLKGLTNLANSFSRFNFDSSNVFKTTSHMDKSRLVSFALDRIREIHGSPGPYNSSYQNSAGINRTFRPRLDWKVREGFLIQPLISQSSWPLQYDPFFSPFDAIALLCRISANTISLDGTSQQSFAYNTIPTVGLGGSKHLDYVTRRDPQWLVSAMMDGLKAYGIEAKEKGNMVFCRISQVRFKYAFFEAIGIRVKKLPLRSVYGIKVTAVLHATRGMWKGPAHVNMLDFNKDSSGFLDIVKSILERAEDEEKMKEVGITVSEPFEGTASYGSVHVKTGEKISYG
ncbi:uncharacterized protein BDZ99DRAFT_471447 [Mytilinidion resinicola]|uniref:Uncharacterized protein n=1 Tax=Mytilinidion resinicola TaxID=574789 RepID=A0A6A6Z531_9PEZI|nr:uncharacterized protein BDZ99DRAFT_471447 [Mytilinidion resinicola]KAF2816186.1 hypothetical protein BDZ99DRAFT_471447 [Mytilinidion resinicola]